MVRAACGGSLSLTWLPPRVVPHEHHREASGYCGAARGTQSCLPLDLQMVSRFGKRLHEQAGWRTLNARSLPTEGAADLDSRPCPGPREGRQSARIKRSKPRSS